MFWKLRWRHFAVSWLVSPLDGVFSLMENERHLTWKRSRDCSDFLVAIFSVFILSTPSKASDRNAKRKRRKVSTVFYCLHSHWTFHTLTRPLESEVLLRHVFFFLLRLIVSWRKSSTEKRHLRDKTSQALIAHR